MNDIVKSVKFNENAHSLPHKEEFRIDAHHVVQIHSERIFQGILVNNEFDIRKWMQGDDVIVNPGYNRAYYELSHMRDYSVQSVLNLNLPYPELRVPLNDSNVIENHWGQKYKNMIFVLKGLNHQPYGDGHSLAKFYYGEDFEKRRLEYMEYDLLSKKEKIKSDHQGNVDYNLTTFIDRVVDGGGNNTYRPKPRYNTPYIFTMTGGNDKLYQPNNSTKYEIYTQAEYPVIGIQPHFMNKEYKFAISLQYLSNGKVNNIELHSDSLGKVQEFPLTIHVPNANGDSLSGNLNQLQLSDTQKEYLDGEVGFNLDKLHFVVSGDWAEKKRMFIVSEEGKISEFPLDKLLFHSEKGKVNLRVEYNLPPIMDGISIATNLYQGEVKTYEKHKPLYWSWFNGNAYLNSKHFLRADDANDEVQKIYISFKSEFLFNFVDQNGFVVAHKALVSDKKNVFSGSNASQVVYEIPVIKALSTAQGKTIEVIRPAYDIMIPKEFVEKMKKYHNTSAKSYDLKMVAKSEDRYGQLSSSADIVQSLYYKMP